MKKTLIYICNFLIFSIIIIIFIKIIPFRGNMRTWQDIYQMLPIILPMCLLVSIFKPIIKPKKKDNKSNISN
jgi:hypothetical protein